MPKRVFPMPDGKQRGLAEVERRAERAHANIEALLVSEIAEAAERAANWAHARRCLTGRQHYIEEMPSNYTDQDYARDRLLQLDQKDANDLDAVSVAYDCLKVEAGDCLTRWERWYILSLLDFERLNGTQKASLNRCLAKIRERVNMSASTGA